MAEYFINSSDNRAYVEAHCSANLDARNFGTVIRSLRFLMCNLMSTPQRPLVKRLIISEARGERG